MTTRHDPDQSLEARLRSDARTLRVNPPEGLDQRISAAVWREREAAREAASRQPRRRSFRFLPPTLAGLVTSVCAVALVILWSDRVDDRARDADIRYLADTVQTLPSRLAAADLTVSRSITVPVPLSREIDAVRADARSALGFLAANFLPSEVLATGDVTDDTATTRDT